MNGISQLRLSTALDFYDSRFSMRCLDVGIVAAICLSPLLFGGRHDLGRLAYCVSVAIAAIGAVGVTVVGRPNRGAIVVGVSAILLVGLQLVPLPPPLLRLLAPESTWWMNGDEWRCLSVAPAETNEGLALLTAHLLFFYAVTKRVASAEGVRRLMWLLSIMTVVVAVEAVAQHIAGNGKLLWLLRHPQRDMSVNIQGLFANRNHLAHFLVLGLGPLWWVTFCKDGAQTDQGRNGLRIAGGVALLFVVGVIVASGSRGGVIALAIAGAVGAAFQIALSKRRLYPAIALVALVGVACTAASVIDDSGSPSRIEEVASFDLETLDREHGRRSIWSANAAAFIARPVAGYGAGSHPVVYPLFMEGGFTREFTHAESGYLQIASENGLAGLAVLLGGLGLLIFWWKNALANTTGNPGGRALLGAVTPGIVASLGHSVFDFVWYLPTLLSVTLVLVACVGVLAQAPRGEGDCGVQGIKTVSWLGDMRLGVVAFAAALAVGILLGPGLGALQWDHYLRISSSSSDLIKRLARDPAAVSDPYLEETILRNTDRAIESLRNVLRHDQLNGRAHLRLAGKLLQKYQLSLRNSENPMPLESIRETVASSEFQRREDLVGWLQRAFGESAELLFEAHQHARAASLLSPLEGDAYVFLAKLSFLEIGSPAPDPFVNLALKVRPNDGAVLYEAGRFAAQLGDYERAVELWRSCAMRPGSHRIEFVAFMSRIMPADTFVEEFQPDPELVEFAFQQYRKLDSTDDVRFFAKHAVETARRAEAGNDLDPAEMAMRWRQVSLMQRTVENYDEAAEAAERACRLSPYDFAIRLEYATALRYSGRYDDADPHLRWCLARRPDLRHLQSWLEESRWHRHHQVADNKKHPTVLSDLFSQGGDALKAPGEELESGEVLSQEPLNESSGEFLIR